MARRRILDTSVLITHWNQCRSGRREPSPKDAAGWARDLIKLRGSDCIVTPVEIEFLAGARSKKETALFQRFLQEFTRLDERSIPLADWQHALRLAQRVPRDGKPRQLGDCLIRAVAHRLNCDVDSFDVTFPA